MKRTLGWVVGIFIAGIVAIGISWVFYAPSQAIRGVWKTEGYGLVLDVSATTIQVYETSNLHCAPSQTIPGHTWLVNFLEGVTFTLESDQLVLDVDGQLNQIRANKIDALPMLCGTELAASPTSVFDVLWDTMNTHYAHFDTHNVDWETRKSLRPDPAATYTDAAMLTLVQDMLTGLDDGHTYIATGTDVWSPSEQIDWHDDRHLVRDNTLAAVPDLSDPSETGLRVGWAAPGIGYIYMTHMDPKTGIGQRGSVVAAQAMSQIMGYLAQAKGIIIDVRYNPGGSDDISMAYAGFFTENPVPVFTKTTRTETGYTAPFTAVLDPQPTSNDVPVVVLTSRFTGSAAEIFTLAMRELPSVTTMGTATSGGLSDGLSFKLPNGWELGMSNQIYLTMDNEGFERVGVRPDVQVDVDVDAAKSGTDNILAAAIAKLQE